MRRTTLVLGLTLAVGIAVGAIGHPLLDAQPQPVKRTPLLKTDVAMGGGMVILFGPACRSVWINGPGP
jgi:hypothetical protein